MDDPSTRDRARAAATRPGPGPWATRATSAIGAFTLVAGAALVARPERVGPWTAFDDPRAARVAGALDVALAPGLLAANRRWPWLAGRRALNLVVAGDMLRTPPAPWQAGRARAFVAFLVAGVAGGSFALRALRSASADN